MKTMTPTDSKWDEFIKRLEGDEGCNFTENGDIWTCHGDHRLSEKILKDMGYDVASSVEYFESHGGYCDCEILFNVW